MLESGGCLLHLCDLLGTAASRLTALGNIANLIIDLADGVVDLGRLGSVLFLGDLTLLVLFPVLLPGLSRFLLSLGSQDLLALASSSNEVLCIFFRSVGV